MRGLLMVAPDSIIPRATPDSENRTDTQTIQGVGGCRLHLPTPRRPARDAGERNSNGLFLPGRPPLPSGEKKSIGISLPGVSRATPGSWGVQVAPPNSLDGLPGIQGNGPRGSQRGYPGTQRPGWPKVLALWHAGSHAVARCRPMNCDKAAIQAFRASSIETHPLGPRRRDFCVEKTPCVWSSYHSCPFTNMRAERDSEGEGERERERQRQEDIEQT